LIQLQPSHRAILALILTLTVALPPAELNVFGVLNDNSTNYIPNIVSSIDTITTTTTPSSSSSSSTFYSSENSKPSVVVSFYPMYEFTKQVGGDKVIVSSLIPLGVEPHDFEPTAQQIQNAETADMLVYNGAGFEGPWTENINAKFVLDTSQGLNLTTNNRVDKQQLDDENNGIFFDPHIWLDPLIAKEQVEKIRDGLKRIDPNNAGYYNENAKRFMSELDTLDANIRSAFTNCEKKDFIAFHNAFGYFADRYGLTQHSIHEAVSPQGEILPQRIQELIELARSKGIDTVYSEDLIDPRLANVIAQEIPNGKVLVLSPLEGIDQEEQKAGIGYIAMMNENVHNLKVGLKCQ
jgi:zinc transport system substrate-binding protein